MAFEWDHRQREFLVSLFARRARRVEAQVPVGGGTLYLDAVVEDPLPTGTFDFLPRLTIIENKAPTERFGRRDLFRFLGKIYLFLATQRTAPNRRRLAGLVLAARITREVRALAGKPGSKRPGIYRLPFDPPIFLVAVDELLLEEPNLAVILHYASDHRAGDLARLAVERGLQRSIAGLYFHRRALLRTVVEELGIDMSRLAIDIRGAVEDLGLRRVMEEVGVARVIEEVGVARVIEEVGVARVIEEVGVARLIDVIGLARLVDEVGADRLREELRRRAAEGGSRHSASRRRAPRQP